MSGNAMFGILPLQDSYYLNRKRMRIPAILLFAVIILFSCKNSENKENQVKNDSLKTETKTEADVEYTCPMHPQVIRKEPGKCPECGMDLQVRS